MARRRKNGPGRPPIGKRAMTVAERQRRYRKMKTQKGGETDMSEVPFQERKAVPLPATREDLLAMYRLKRRRTINDHVEDIVVKIWDDDTFHKYIDAIYDSQAVEGTMDDDDVMAAMLIRDFAKKNNSIEVANANIHTVKLAMRVALRRFGQYRGQRPLEVPPLPEPPITTTEQAAAE